MASSEFAKDRGFEEELFQSPVSANFKCSICLNVLNNPKSCRNNQHYFCSGCIDEHLKNSRTCPQCMEELTPETLIQPPRVLLNCILELRIKCLHSQRGCPKYVQLGRLQNHADECGFAPAQCENEGCGAEVNRDEKVRHETEFCKFRKVECYGCEELKKEIQELRKGQEEANKKMEEKQHGMERKMAEVLENQVTIKEGVKEALKESKQALQESLSKIERIFNDDDQSNCLATSNPQTSKLHVAQSPQQISRRINRDIFVMGGVDYDNKPVNSVEKFCSKEGKWIHVAPMIVPRMSASSVVCDNVILVSGGEIPDQSTSSDDSDSDESDRRESSQPTDSIEVLYLDRLPLKWVMFPGKLPTPMVRHQTFVYKGKLIVVGTYREIERDKRGREVSKTNYHRIYEIFLSPPYSSTQLYSLSDLSDRFIAELINDKLFIFGGHKDNVKSYNLDANECVEMPRLPCPYPFIDMANVQWNNDVILLGGGSCNYGRSSDKIETIQYNTITGESKRLAPTNMQRLGCAAVITDDVIIAMGGIHCVNSVECYNFHTNTWQALPVMKARRYQATAVVFP